MKKRVRRRRRRRRRRRKGRRRRGRRRTGCLKKEEGGTEEITLKNLKEGRMTGRKERKERKELKEGRRATDRRMLQCELGKSLRATE